MKVLIDGQLVEYRKEGAGNAVLLLHGWGASLGTFDQLAAFLVKKGYTVYRIDFPGFGASPAPQDAWTVGRYAKLTAAFVRKMKIKKLSAVFGHSFGGRVIIKAVATGILEADKMILMGSAGIKPPTTLKKQAFIVTAKAGKLLTSVPGMRRLQSGLKQKLYKAAGSTDYLNAGALQKTFVKTINEDLTHYLAKIIHPTLLVWGELDTETPISDAHRMKKELKNAKLVILPGAGHFVYSDDFSGTTSAIERFLR